jgi:hypothetical protein
MPAILSLWERPWPRQSRASALPQKVFTEIVG